MSKLSSIIRDIENDFTSRASETNDKIVQRMMTPGLVPVYTGKLIEQIQHESYGSFYEPDWQYRLSTGQYKPEYTGNWDILREVHRAGGSFHPDHIKSGTPYFVDEIARFIEMEFRVEFRLRERAVEELLGRLNESIDVELF